MREEDLSARLKPCPSQTTAERDSYPATIPMRSVSGHAFMRAARVGWAAREGHCGKGTTFSRAVMAALLFVIPRDFRPEESFAALGISPAGSRRHQIFAKRVLTADLCLTLCSAGPCAHVIALAVRLPHDCARLVWRGRGLCRQPESPAQPPGSFGRARPLRC